VSFKFLVDTNVLSEPRRLSPDPGIMTALERHATQIVTAAPVWFELRYGVARLPESHQKKLLSRYLESVIRATIPIFPYDEEAATWHATQRALLERQGHTPPFVDGQIAAIAATNDLCLVTANVSDFSCFQSLEIVDWSSST
jgi:tRNA(fMet)-specific endonuclease VapC